ncbi:hypothetical protein PCASD_23076 [Puccinia coronata f. sp. avenae]|uniref:Uncharacterized protein n=1 Tax=Puccinia coronata f. sp. avenae TaxID=200324 RepID=A0A2N5TPP2_9BASI|nr:hypothetical protein PCASD_23076 [Puccinia coronata f. sp. avenae]
MHACPEGLQGLHALWTGVHGQHACPAGPHAKRDVLTPFVGMRTACGMRGLIQQFTGGLLACPTAGINRSNTAARAVLEQPCSTGGRTDTVRPKREPTGRTDLSDRSWLVLCNRSQELIGQACPTRRQVLRSDSACPTTGQTRLFEHRSNCRVRPVNAGSAPL